MNILTFWWLLVVLVAESADSSDSTQQTGQCTKEKKHTEELQHSVKKLEQELQMATFTISELMAASEAEKVISEDMRAKLAECGDKDRISLLKLGSQVCGVAGDAASRVLQSTGLDETVLNHVSTGAVAAGKATASLTVDMVNKVSSVDYAHHYATITNSEAIQVLTKKTEALQPYFEGIRPALTKAQELAMPVLQNVEPALQKAKTATQPIFHKAVEVASTDVFPAMKTGGAKAVDSMVSVGFERLDLITKPIFDRAAAVLPQHQQSFPQHPVDRALFLVAFVLFLYYSMYVLKFSLRLTLRVVKKTTLMSFWIFRVAVFLPLKIAKKMISTVFWVVTLFYCCGLCHSKKSKKTAKKTNGETETNGIKGGNSAGNVTVAEIVKILETAKKGNNVQKGLDLLAKHVKNKTPMTQPKSVAGKHLTKEALLEACKKLSLPTKGLGV